MVADAVRRCRNWPCEVPDTGTLRGYLIALIEMTAAHIAGEDGPLLAGVLMAMRRDPELAAEMRTVSADKPDLSGQICARAVARGQLPAGCRAGLIEELVPPLLFMRGIVRGDPIDHDYIQHVVDDIVLPLLTA